MENEKYNAHYWLSIADAYEIAAVCGCNPQTVYQWKGRCMPEQAVRLLSLYYGLVSMADYEDRVEKERTEISKKLSRDARRRRDAKKEKVRL